MFMALGSTILPPAAHAMMIHGVKIGLQGFAVERIANMILLDFLALFFYLSHIPYVFSHSTIRFPGQLWSLRHVFGLLAFQTYSPVRWFLSRRQC